MVNKYNSQSVLANVLLAHGSRDKSWKKPFEELLEKCVNRSPEKTFCLCYLELCDPKLEEVVKYLTDNYPKISTIKIHPLFLSAGVHVNKDIQEILSNLRKSYPNIKFYLNDVIGKNTIVTNAIYKVIST